MVATLILWNSVALRTPNICIRDHHSWAAPQQRATVIYTWLNPSTKLTQSLTNTLPMRGMGRGTICPKASGSPRFLPCSNACVVWRMATEPNVASALTYNTSDVAVINVRKLDPCKCLSVVAGTTHSDLQQTAVRARSANPTLMPESSMQVCI